MSFVPRDDSPEPQHPGEQSFDTPSVSVAAEATAILRLGPRGRSMRGNELGTPRCEADAQREAVVSLVAYKIDRDLVYEACVERVEDQLRFMALTTRNPDGDRKAMAVCHCHDLGRFAASSDANLKTPLFAPAWVPSMYASVRSSLPLARRSSASAVRIRSKTPSLSHF